MAGQLQLHQHQHSHSHGEDTLIAGVPPVRRYYAELGEQRARTQPRCLLPQSRDALAVEASKHAGDLVSALLLTDMAAVEAASPDRAHAFDAPGLQPYNTSSNDDGGDGDGDGARAVARPLDGSLALSALSPAELAALTAGGSPSRGFSSLSLRLSPSGSVSSHVTTADSRLLRARFTRHTAASAAHLRTSGRPAVRHAPAFVNVASLVAKSMMQGATQLAADAQAALVEQEAAQAAAQAEAEAQAQAAAAAVAAEEAAEHERTLQAVAALEAAAQAQAQAAAEAKANDDAAAMQSASKPASQSQSQSHAKVGGTGKGGRAASPGSASVASMASTAKLARRRPAAPAGPPVPPPYTRRATSASASASTTGKRGDKSQAQQQAGAGTGAGSAVAADRWRQAARFARQAAGLTSAATHTHTHELEELELEMAPAPEAHAGGAAAAAGSFSGKGKGEPLGPARNTAALFAAAFSGASGQHRDIASGASTAAPEQPRTRLTTVQFLAEPVRGSSGVSTAKPVAGAGVGGSTFSDGHDEGEPEPEPEGEGAEALLDRLGSSMSADLLSQLRRALQGQSA